MQIVALFHPKARAWVAGRKGLVIKLRAELPPLIQSRPVAWFHAASLGEFEQGRPVIEAFKARYPDYFILLTFFSPSGYEVRKNYAQADYICYLPVDTAANAKQFVQLTNPKVAFFIKYEFWYYYLRVLRQENSIILSFSAIFRPGQLFFKPYGGFYRNLLNYFDHLLVQNQESADLLEGIDVQQVTVAGDTRFDRVTQIVEAARDLPEIDAFVHNTFCLIVGSAWETDREILVPALNAIEQPMRVIIAPHEIHEQELSRWEQTLNGSTLRYSAYKAANFDLSVFPSANNLLIDNIGMLSSLYRYGQVAYIGGAFGAGLHNILEAATFGLPILFGDKNYQKFQEALDLRSEGGAWAVHNTNELEQKLRKFMEEPECREIAGEISENYVRSHTGATDAVMRCLTGYLQ